jgi:hypothetical protein
MAVWGLGARSRRPLCLDNRKSAAVPGTLGSGQQRALRVIEDGCHFGIRAGGTVVPTAAASPRAGYAIFPCSEFGAKRQQSRQSAYSDFHREALAVASPAENEVFIIACPNFRGLQVKADPKNSMSRRAGWTFGFLPTTQFPQVA